MHMMESLTASMNEMLNKTTMSMNEMFHKSQASSELEQMQCGIAGMADQVQALETRLPITTTDPHAIVADTHVDGDPFAEDPGVDNDEHSELPDPPPRQHQPFNWQGMGVIKITTTNTMFATMILLLRINFLSLLLMARMMLRLIEIGRWLLSKSLVPTLFLNNIVLVKPLVSLKILLLSGGMNWLPLGYHHIHGMG
jgi:hypothetical protein